MNTSEPSQNRPRIRRGWLRALLGLLVWFILNLIVSIAGAIGASLIFGFSLQELTGLASNPDMIHVLLFLQLISMLATLVIVWGLCKLIDRRSFRSLGWEAKGHQKEMAIGFFIGLILILAGFIILFAAGLLTIDSVRFPVKSILITFMLFIVVAVSEELIMRGYVLNNLMVSMNKYIALVVSSLLFMVLHLRNPNVTVLGMTNVFLAGLLLGAFYIHHKNLWLPIFLHFSWNFFQGPVLGFEVSGVALESIIAQTINGPNWLTGGEFGYEGSLLANISLLLAFVGLDVWSRMKKTNRSTDDSDATKP
ncbi:CPBP family intramembrane metalloprotease [candidate division KSB1 bacterium]|nr:CPBP family intramembrane metalloprotease [candidate division KSB1 bacterium]